MNLAKCGFPIKKSDLIGTVEKNIKDSGNTPKYRLWKLKVLTKQEQWLQRNVLGQLGKIFER